MNFMLENKGSSVRKNDKKDVTEDSTPSVVVYTNYSDNANSETNTPVDRRKKNETNTENV